MGWEDHMQSDQFHYLHHARFECNYGSGSVPLDNWFGTFRDSLGESKSYRGAAKGAANGTRGDSALKTNAVRPQGAAFPDAHTVSIFGFTAACFGLLAHALHAEAVGKWQDADADATATAGRARSVAAIVAFAPCALCFVLHHALGDRLPATWPFHKENAPKFSLHFVIGFVVGVLPCYYLVEAVL